jgi:5'-nucleotidase
MRWTGSVLTGAFAVGLLAGCLESAEEPLDGENEAFVVDGKVDALDIAEGSAVACAVLKLVNLADLHLLDHVVALNARAAAAIIAARDGADGFLANLAELDAVKWVGPQAFRRLLAYATSHPEYTCGAVEVQLLAFNDFHGSLEPPTGSSGRIGTVEAGGAEYLATHIAARRSQNPNTFVVAAGDIIGATPLLSALFHDEPTIESMNLMGLAIAGVGNHEFDEGVAELWRMQDGGCHPVDGCADGDDYFGGAEFEYLAANVVVDTTGDTVFPPYAIRRVGNARIAFIGLTLEGTPLVTTQEGVAGLTFFDEAETINALVPRLRARGIEAIVVLLHEGGFSSGPYNGCAGISGPLFQIVSELDPAVDVVVAGHTNAAHVCDIDGRLVTSAAHASRLLTDIDLTIDELTGEVTARRGENLIVTRDVPKDAAQSALIARYQQVAAPLANRVVGSATADLTRAIFPAVESTMGNLIADAQLAGTRSNGAVAAFMNPGGVRADILRSSTPGGEAVGEITYGELFSVQPFGNNLITFDVTGAQLELMLEQQWSIVSGSEKANMLAVSEGFTYAYDPSRPLGDRIDPADILLDGAPVDPSQTYRITANSFLAAGGDGFSVLALGTNRAPGPLDLVPLEEYVASHSPLSPPAIGRVNTVVAP